MEAGSAGGSGAEGAASAGAAAEDAGERSAAAGAAAAGAAAAGSEGGGGVVVSVMVSVDECSPRSVRLEAKGGGGAKEWDDGRRRMIRRERSMARAKFGWKGEGVQALRVVSRRKEK